MSNLLLILQTVFNNIPENIVKGAVDEGMLCCEWLIFKDTKNFSCIFKTALIDVVDVTNDICAKCPFNINRDFSDYTYHVVMGGIGYREK